MKKHTLKYMTAAMGMEIPEKRKRGCLCGDILVACSFVFLAWQ